MQVFGFWFLIFCYFAFCLKTLFLFIAKCVVAPPRPEFKHGCRQWGQWHSKRGKWGHAPWGRNSRLFAVIL